jgi:prepilin-type N-terminal cleavage/methylation domain-containing protein
MMKARAGVTLVELLVVILIVTILSVSMLPLLQPFVTEAQYAAEAIPVIGNLRTKIGLYQYDKGRLPVPDGSAGATNLIVQTWRVDDSDPEKFIPAAYTIGDTTGPVDATNSLNGVANHIQKQVDVDYQDLKGKRSKPNHYQYFVISAVANPSYVVGCFGDGNGLKGGTGYAVCELNYPKRNKKFIGTWKRYKPKDEEVAIQFTTDASAIDDDMTNCYVPDPDDFASDAQNATASDTEGLPQHIKNMKDAGWEF